MGKIIVDEIVQKLLNDTNESSLGLIIGTVSEQDSTFCVAHIAQTLEERKSDHELLKWKSFSEILPGQVAHHAKQVIRMLPGGLYVLGLYVKQNSEIFTSKFESTLKSLMTAVNKGLNRNVHYCSDYKNDKIILHFNNKKMVIKSMDANYKLKSVEVSVMGKIEWKKLECEYDTVSVMHLDKNATLPLKKNLEVLMKTFDETLRTAKFLIEGDIPSKEVVFQEPEEKELSSDDECASATGDLSDEDNLPSISTPISPIHILIDQIPGALRAEAGDGHEDFVEHLHLQGKIAAVAFVVAGDSRFHVSQLLREDILRSMSSRIEMHCESLVDEEQSSEDSSRVYHEVPRRVFAYLPSTKLLVSDYLFPGEGPHDSLVSFNDLLSLQVQDSQVIVHKEIPFDLDDLQLKGSMEELLSKAESITKLQNGVGQRKVIAYFFLAAVAIAFFSFTIPLFNNF